MVRKTTIYAVYDRFVETGRFDAFQCNWKEGMPNQPHYFWDSDVAKWMEARPEAIFHCNRYAVQRGPVVYCMESVDNGPNIRDIRLDSKARFVYGKHAELGVPQLSVKAWRRRPGADGPLYSVRHESLEMMRAVLIPYYAFANRGEAEMQVWHYLIR